MGDYILVTIQKNANAGPTMILVSPEGHAEAPVGYPLHFSGMKFTADPTTSSLTVQGQNILVKKSHVWVANSGGTLPTGLEQEGDYYVREVNGQQVQLAENRRLTEPATFTDSGTGT